MSNLNEPPFTEAEESDRITVYEPFTDSASEVIEYLPKGSMVLVEEAYPNMSCHSFVLGALNKIKDPKNTWVNYGAALSLLEDAIATHHGNQNTLYNSQPQLIIFNRVYEKYDKIFPAHSGFLIPNYGVLSAVEGVINFASIDSLVEHFNIDPVANWGHIFISACSKELKQPLDLEKLYIEFGISFE
jgi:hypothetical protein